MWISPVTKWSVHARVRGHSTAQRERRAATSPSRRAMRTWPPAPGPKPNQVMAFAAAVLLPTASPSAAAPEGPAGRPVSYSHRCGGGGAGGGSTTHLSHAVSFLGFSVSAKGRVQCSAVQCRWRMGIGESIEKWMDHEIALADLSWDWEGDLRR